jgi:hypothetical protein
MAKDRVSPVGEDSQLSPTEIWKPVPSEPGVLASSLGRILLMPGYAPLPNGGYRAYFPEPRLGQVAKSTKTAKHLFRHIAVKRHGASRQQTRKVHQLVCEAFHGPKPFPEAVVIHLDEDGLNNRPENLKWGSQRENMNMPKFTAYCRSRTGDQAPTIKGKRARAAS